LGDPGESVAQIGFRVDAVELGRLRDRIEGGCALAAGVGAGEEVVLAPQRDPAQGVLGDVVIRFEAGIDGEARQRVAPLGRVTSPTA